jgi:NADPH:quinone reductase-like Zn-dependent oxidoreductase
MQGDLMKAIVQERFGPPDVIQLVDTDPPEVGAGEVLVRVHAAALNPYDWHIVRGDLSSRGSWGSGLTKPKARVAGVDAAGRVEAAGANVRGLRHGDQVLGFCRGGFTRSCGCRDCTRTRHSLVRPARYRDHARRDGPHQQFWREGSAGRRGQPVS